VRKKKPLDASTEGLEAVSIRRRRLIQRETSPLTT